MLVTSHQLQRTLCIRAGSSLGTAFTVDRNSRQYLVTARHVVDTISPGQEIQIRRERQWIPARVHAVAFGADQVDIAVLTFSHLLTPTPPLELTTVGLTLGQPVAFLGFPFGWEGGAEAVNNGYPIPFVKAGVFSARLFGAATKLYVDAHGNPGFSGGPLIFVDHGPPLRCKVAGVVSDSPLDPITAQDAGFVRAISIDHILSLIDANSLGFAPPPHLAPSE